LREATEKNVADARHHATLLADVGKSA